MKLGRKYAVSPLSFWIPYRKACKSGRPPPPPFWFAGASDVGATFSTPLSADLCPSGVMFAPLALRARSEGLCASVCLLIVGSTKASPPSNFRFFPPGCVPKPEKPIASAMAGSISKSSWSAMLTCKAGIKSTLVSTGKMARVYANQRNRGRAWLLASLQSVLTAGLFAWQTYQSTGDTTSGLTHRAKSVMKRIPDL